MNQKLPVVRPRQLVRALERAGFFVHYQTGSHARLLHKTRAELRVTVPIHSKDIPPYLLKRILRQASLTEEELRKLL